jgi:putative addiction module CopG family antidote
MRTTRQFSITLPNEMAGLVKSMVATGAYATESEVFRDGLRALMARERAMEQWLHDQVGPAYDALKAEPSRAVSPDKVRARIVNEYKAMSGKAK